MKKSYPNPEFNFTLTKKFGICTYVRYQHEKIELKLKIHDVYLY
jgi:hypothetical protein